MQIEYCNYRQQCKEEEGKEKVEKDENVTEFLVNNKCAKSLFKKTFICVSWFLSSCINIKCRLSFQIRHHLSQYYLQNLPCYITMVTQSYQFTHKQWQGTVSQS